MPSAGAYLLALALTLAVEVPIYGGALGRRAGTAAALGTGLLVNLVSHPVAFLVVHPLLHGPVGDEPSLVMVEVMVLGGEAAMTARRHRDGELAVVASALANVSSLTVGWALLG